MKNQPLKFFKPETIKGRYNFKLLQKHTAVGLSDIFKFKKFIQENIMNRGLMDILNLS